MKKNINKNINKPKKIFYEQKLIWIVMVIVFLSVVQWAFNRPPDKVLIESAWGAGDLISFVGTIVLGYIAVNQTQRYNNMVDVANK